MMRRCRWLALKKSPWSLLMVILIVESITAKSKESVRSCWMKFCESHNLIAVRRQKHGFICHILSLCFHLITLLFFNSRKPMKLNNVLVPYNLAMAALNLYIFLQLGISVFRLRYNVFCQPCRQINSPDEMRVSSIELAENCSLFFYFLWIDPDTWRPWNTLLFIMRAVVFISLWRDLMWTL